MNNALNQLPISFFIMPAIILFSVIGMLLVLRRSAQKRSAKSRGQSSAFPERPRSIPMQTPETRTTSASGRGVARISPVSDRTQSGSSYDDLAQPDLDMLLPQRSTAPSAAPSPSKATPLEGPPLEHDWLAALSSEPTPASAPAPEGMPLASSQKHQPDGEDMVEVMRVYRTLSDGKLVVQIGNQRYRSVSEMKDADMAQRFSDAALELSAMTGNAPGSRLKSLAGSVVAATTAVSAPAIQPVNPGGIAQAIEDFLQFKLSSHSTFSTRSIHIKPGQNQGVRIEVDKHSYDAIGDVVDPDVRDFLFGVMREWDARH